MDVGRSRADAEREQAIDLDRLVGGVRRRWRWVAWPTLAAMLAAGAFVLTANPRYTGVAKVLLEDQESYYTRLDRAPGYDPAATVDDEAVQSQAEAVATTDLARKAIDKLGLATSSELNPDSDGNADQRAVDKFLSRLTVFPVPRSRVLEIEFVSRDPGLAARGANAVADVYLQSQTEAKASAARAAGSWLLRKIEDLCAKVADADTKVEAFRAESGLLAGANGQTVSAEPLSDLNVQLGNARSAETAATAKSELLRKLEEEDRLDEAPASIADESMRRFVEQRVELRHQIAEASRTFLPSHPHVKELNAQLVGLDDQIRDAAAKSVRVFENDARLAREQVASLSAALAEQSMTVATGNADDVRLRALDMEAKAAREQLESYLQKYHEAAERDADSAAPANARLIATAEPPRAPTSPKVWPTILLATLSAFVVSTSVAAAATLAADEGRREESPAAPIPDRAMTTPRAGEAPAQPDLPAATAVELPLPKVHGVGRIPIDAVRSAESLADRLLRSSSSEEKLVVLITGDRSARALAVALGTARRLSARDSTLLVDIGATQDWFADILDREDTGEVEVAGLVDLLAGRAGFGEVIRRDLSSSLDVIPCGGDVCGDKLADVFAAFVSAYACAVFHASDWRSTPAQTVAAIAGAVVIVAPAERSRRALEQAQAGLREARGEIFAFAEPAGQPALEEVA
jgi:uncharacterized protein involved in exopolysaccharide biosynthesis